MANIVTCTFVLLVVWAPFDKLTEARNPRKADEIPSGLIKDDVQRKFLDENKTGKSMETAHVKGALKAPNENSSREDKKSDDNPMEQLQKKVRKGHRNVKLNTKSGQKIPPNLTEKDIATNLEAFKRYLKMKLEFEGIKEERVPRNFKLPSVLDLEVSQAGDAYRVSKDGFHAKPKTVYVWATNLSANCSDIFDYACLGFESLNRLSEDSYIIKSAMLYIRGRSKPKLKLKLYSLKKTKSTKNKSFRKLREKHFLTHFSLSGELMGLEVTNIVTKWIDRPKNNRGLGVVIKSKDEKTIEKRHPDLFKDKNYTPFLEINVLPIPQKARNPACTGNETQCCRNIINVKASQILPNIIVPDNFQVTFCSGSCDDSTISTANNFTRMIQSFRWRTETQRNSVHFCCAPIAFKSQSILVYKAGNIIKYDVPDLIPTACGCI